MLHTASNSAEKDKAWEELSKLRELRRATKEMKSERASLQLFEVKLKHIQSSLLKLDGKYIRKEAKLQEIRQKNRVQEKINAAKQKSLSEWEKKLTLEDAKKSKHRQSNYTGTKTGCIRKVNTIFKTIGTQTTVVPTSETEVQTDKIVAPVEVPNVKSHRPSGEDSKVVPEVGIPRHFGKNSGQLEVPCHICGKVFSRRTRVNRHVQQVHKDFRPTNSTDSVMKFYFE